MKGLTLLSPAKINLFFRVLRKREDGYHDIASLFQMVDFCDIFSISIHPSEDVFSTNNTLLRWDQSNLIYRAVELFKQKTDIHFFVQIDLQKNIPMQAGLGGGSGNAATILYALNKLLNTQVPETTLASWGSTLGADVSSFFSTGRVFCEGIGEKLTHVAKRQEKYWILKPKNLALSTPEVFSKLSFNQISSRCPYDLLETFAQGCGEPVNDLEEAAFNILPSLQSFKKRFLDLGFHHVVMTGSGTAFIGFGDVKPFYLPDVDVWQVQSVYRSSHDWYTSGSVY